MCLFALALDQPELFFNDKIDKHISASLVFFHNPNYDVVIECIPSCQGPDQPPKYPLATSGEHLR
jgi:isopenicillin N synthase-like dioxygenase